MPICTYVYIIAGRLRFEHRPLVLETNMLPLTPSTQKNCSPRRIRTVTEQVLNLLPLPIGLQDRGGIISPNIRSTTLTLTGQAVYQISPDAILAIVLPQGLEPWTH